MKDLLESEPHIQIEI
jgi:hypothetical protein